MVSHFEIAIRNAIQELDRQLPSRPIRPHQAGTPYDDVWAARELLRRAQATMLDRQGAQP